ncbi:MAG: MarR family winged helix-turn-helix transcriptional regulator [Methyloprofundus sp.]
MNKANIFEVIECMAALIRPEERRRCTELKLQLVHLQVLEYLSLCNKYSDTPAAIANFLGMTRGTVSQSLIILEERAYIKKIRILWISVFFMSFLLQKGRNILKKAKPTELFNKASAVVSANSSIVAGEELFIEALRALQKSNDSNSFGVCKTCKNFSTKSHSFFCELTQEKLSKNDSEKICQKHDPV